LVALADAELDPLGPPGRWVFTADAAEVLSLAGLDADAAQARVAALARARLEAARAAANAAMTSGPKRRAKRRASRPVVAP
jgi:hypothetical protein